MSYPAAALFYWQRAKRAREKADGLGKQSAIEDLRLIARVGNYPLLAKMATRDLELIVSAENDTMVDEVYMPQPIKLEWPR